MKFGAVSLEESLGAIIAHGLTIDSLVLKKGEIVTPQHVAALRAAHIETMTVAQLETGDVEENAAAWRLAAAVAGTGLRIETPSTGRVNIFATCDGIAMIDSAAVDRVNAVDEGITLATLPPMQQVTRDEMVATIKIIPFSVPEMRLAETIAALGSARLAVAEFRPMRIGVVSTLLPGLKMSIVTKTLQLLAERIVSTGSSIVVETRVPHSVAALAHAIDEISAASDIVIVFGASAIADRRDVVPAAIESRGGEIVHFGMPVDPGNLLLLARLADGRPIIGAPGCARSPKESGFDWVLQRLLADVPVTGADIRRMGMGGLLIGRSAPVSVQSAYRAAG